MYVYNIPPQHQWKAENHDQSDLGGRRGKEEREEGEGGEGKEGEGGNLSLILKHLSLYMCVLPCLP